MSIEPELLRLNDSIEKLDIKIQLIWSTAEELNDELRSVQKELAEIIDSNK